MLNLPIVRRTAAILISLLSLVAAAHADERKATEILPPSTVIFAEIRQPERVVAAVYEDDLVRRIEALEPVRAAMEKKPYLDFKAGVAIVESQMGLPWRKIVEQALGGGVTFAVDAKTQGAAILARASDEAIHSKLLETLANLARLDAKSKDKPDPVKMLDYRGIRVYAADKNKLAVVGEWLVITNNDDLGKQIIDRYLDKAAQTLAADAQFAKAYEAASTTSTAWAYVNATALRDAGVAKKLLGGQAENPLAELFFGGILTALHQTPYVTIGLNGADRHIHVTASAPYDPKWAKDLREYYFGPEGKGVAPTQLAVDDTILTLSSYRNVSGMWVRAGDLFNEQMNEELAKADSGLTTLFGGKDFGEDILGAIRPEVRVVVARQRFVEGQPVPAIKLPAFGLVAELKDPAKMQPELRRTFQSAIGFLNIVGATNGQPQLDLDMEKTDAAQFVTASYIADPGGNGAQAAKINYNFSPSIAFSGNRFIVASTKEFAHALTSANASERVGGNEKRVVNTDAVVQFDALRETLADNRGQLVAQNMLKEGHTKEEAERDIGLLLELVGWLDHLAFSMDTTPSELRLSLDLAMKPAG